MADFLTLLAAGDKRARSILGEPVTYSPGVGIPVTVPGIFDFHAIGVDVGEVGISSQGPRVFLTLSDLPTDPTADEACVITVRGLNFKAYNVQPDGEGGVYLSLNKVVP